MGTMKNILLTEATATPVKSNPGRWRAVLITPGQGSSGFYSESLLAEYGPVAFRKGAKSFVTHNATENGERDPFRMWGFLAEDATYEEGVGLVGEIEVLPSWRDRVEEVAPHVALSVRVAGEKDTEGNITEFYEDDSNGVDLVVFPGRPGSGLVEKLYESASGSSEPSVTPTQEKKEEKNMEEKLDLILAKLGLLETFVTESKQAAEKTHEEAEAIADADAKVEQALESYEAARVAVEGANLLPSQVESILAEARRGVDVAPLVESAKKVVAEAKEITEAAAPVGRFGSTGASEDFFVAGLKVG